MAFTKLRKLGGKMKVARKYDVKFRKKKISYSFTHTNNDKHLKTDPE